MDHLAGSSDGAKTWANCVSSRIGLGNMDLQVSHLAVPSPPQLFLPLTESQIKFCIKDACN